MTDEMTDFVRDLFKVANIPARPISCPSDDFSMFDFGLRTEILGASKDDWNAFMNRNMEMLKIGSVYHHTDPFRCNYTLMKLSDSDIILIGPFLFEQIKEDALEKLTVSLGLPDFVHSPLQSFYASLTFVPYQAMYEGVIVLLADRLFGKKKYTVTHRETDTLDEWMHLRQPIHKTPVSPLRSIETSEKLNELESVLMQAVTNGNESEALEVAGEISKIINTRHVSNELRDAKNNNIIMNTLLRKSAEYSGIHPVHFNTLFESFMEKTEKLTGVEECRSCMRKMVRDYCRMVREFDLKTYSLPIRKIITSIRTDLSADLSLHAFADSLNVNASYLSSLFKKEMGVTLTEYVNTARIHHAKILLIATDLPVKSVAARCGVTDLRYFSRIFHRITGETPTDYRTKNTYNHTQHYKH